MKKWKNLRETSLSLFENEKHENESDYCESKANLTDKQLARTRQLGSLLYECGDDVDFWAERLGFTILREQLKNGFAAVLVDSYIVLKNGMSDIEEIVSIAHEICHKEFHATSIAWRHLSTFQRSKNEAQAELFAAMVVEPCIIQYATDEEYLVDTKLPKATAHIRLDYFFRTHN